MTSYFSWKLSGIFRQKNGRKQSTELDQSHCNTYSSSWNGWSRLCRSLQSHETWWRTSCMYLFPLQQLNYFLSNLVKLPFLLSYYFQQVGSFARGLFLVHSECLESNYITSRPFRVNAVSCAFGAWTWDYYIHFLWSWTELPLLSSQFTTMGWQCETSSRNLLGKSWLWCV